MDAFERSSFDPEDVRARQAEFVESLNHAAAAANMPGGVENALVYIHAHLFDHDLSVNKTCAECDLRDHNITSFFKVQMGIAMGDYIARKRVEMAQILLVHFNLPIMEIGWLVGYDYPETFARVFRRIAGESAGAFRRRQAQD